MHYCLDLDKNTFVPHGQLLKKTSNCEYLTELFGYKTITGMHAHSLIKQSQSSHRIIKWFVLKETSKAIQFQPP